MRRLVFFLLELTEFFQKLSRIPKLLDYYKIDTKKNQEFNIFLAKEREVFRKVRKNYLNFIHNLLLSTNYYITTFYKIFKKFNVRET